MTSRTPARTIAREDPGQPDVRAMLAAGDALYAALYPAESNHLLDAAALQDRAVPFYVVRQDGRAIGCGAIVRQAPDWAEIKRMYVDPAARGRGIGKLILDTLLDHARANGVRVARLETGVKQGEALGLYRAAGFAERAAFGFYAPDPTSVFMEKTL